jgi:prepilin-type N-terminal cleavage/methylation domain-containing protein
VDRLVASARFARGRQVRTAAGGRARGGPQRGMTILEIMIALAVMGLLMLVGLPALRTQLGSDLREDANGVASAMRAAYELASLSGVHHRVLLDLDAQTYEIQACPEDLRLARGDEEKVVDKDVLETVPKPEINQTAGIAGEVLEAESPEDAVKTAAALAGINIGGARCVVPTTPNGDADARGNQRQLNEGRKIRFGEVHVQHLDRPAKAGKVAINFFPLGWAEKAVVEIAAPEGDRYTILVHGMTGRVELLAGAFDADKHMRRDAAGDEVDER